MGAERSKSARRPTAAPGRFVIATVPPLAPMARVAHLPRPDRHRLIAARSRQDPANPRTRGTRPQRSARSPVWDRIRPPPKSSTRPLRPQVDADAHAAYSRRVPHLIFWPPAHLPAPAGRAAATPGALAPGVACLPPANRHRGGNPPARSDRCRRRMRLPHAQDDRDVLGRVPHRDPRPIFRSRLPVSCAGVAGGGAAGTPTPRPRRRRLGPGSSSRDPTARR